ncbi:MAG: OmpA family protein [Pseudomonadota bacterium]
MNLRKAMIVNLLAILSLSFGQLALANSVKDRMFGHALKAQESADSANAKHLAPDTYKSAASALKSAEQRFSSGKSVESIQKKLLQAEETFEKSKLIAEISAEKLGGLLKARMDAKAVSAQDFNKRDWTRAETAYKYAIAYMEDGRQRAAFEKVKIAAPLYREMELEAIKAQFLTDTRLLLVQAKKERSKRYAPKTLQKAQMLLAEAERELTENRYDADKPRSLARQAQYEAQHALYLTRYAKEAREKQRTTEDIVLEWEEPLQQIAASADMVAHFEQGHATTTNDVLNYIEERNVSAQKLEQEISDRDQQILAMEDNLMAMQADISDLHARLGDKALEQEQLAREQQRLQRRLAFQEDIRQKVLELEDTFTRTEANVFRDSDQVYIRLVGLNFDSGSASVKAEHFNLLKKVHEAITVFPGSDIYIEGHTDAYGGDESNLVLSEKRAFSIRDYLSANTSLTSDMMKAVGYGETKPVANNETPQGRKKNRRIDVRIVPHLDLSQAAAQL